MRTNIEIDDDLMAAAMEAGAFKTKREAVEEGLRLIKRRKAYADLLAARGTLFWDDSDAAWANVGKGAAQSVVAEKAAAPYAAKPGAPGAKKQKPQASPSTKRARSRGKAA